MPRLSDKLLLFYTLLKSANKVAVTQQTVQNYEDINKALEAARDLALKQSRPNKILRRLRSDDQGNFRTKTFGKNFRFSCVYAGLTKDL